MKHTAHSHPGSFAPSAPRWMLLPAIVGLVGCGSDAMSLGSNEVAVEQGECLAGELTGDIVASSQADIDALSGCEELPGSLRIVTPAGAPGSISLEPLGELRRVYGQLQISGPITSLAGLESLETVGVLTLRDTLLPDLIPLRGLTRVDTPADWRVDGIQIQDCDELGDLRGLENLIIWGSLLIIESDGLVSLAGLQAPERIASVRLINVPQLADVSALAPARRIEFLDLTGTAVTGFDGFQLESGDLLNLNQNHALTDLDGLSRLEEVGHLGIVDNDALVRMDLPQLRAWDSVLVTYNDALLEVPDYDSGGSAWSGFSSGLEGVPSDFSRRSFEVGDNPLVTQISMLDPFGVQSIVIYRNASLTTLDLRNTQRANTLWIQDNAALASANVSGLGQVVTLTIRNNPSLSVAPFAAVQAFTRDVTGNLDAIAP